PAPLRSFPTRRSSDLEAFVEREPVTVVVSEKGWVRTMKGHVADLSGLAFKTDDKLDHAFFAESTSKLLVFASNGKFYSLDVAKLDRKSTRLNSSHQII